MPLYEFECDACHHRFERIQKFTDPPPDVCPSCGKGSVRKLPSSPAIQFKGTGWYVTDYARKSGKDTGTKSDGADTSSSSSPATTTTGSTPMETASKSSEKSSEKSSDKTDKTEKKR